MSRIESTLLRSAVVVAVAVFICSPAEATDRGPDVTIAATVLESTGVSWLPKVHYQSAELSVSGPGDFSLRLEFAANEALVFRVGEKNRPALEDGQYAWELRFSPVTDAAVKDALREARASGDSGEIEALKKQGKLPAEPFVISGYFRVKAGWIVVDEREAPVRQVGRRAVPSGTTETADSDSGLATKDQVILDDLIVDGSACVGQDCVNGESFGFDTIRIKENNLRIRAVDTSSTASFPTRDWQITFNESSNGGANKFSIDDIDGGRTPFTIEAGAPSHSLYVDDGGRIGFGTSTPVADLHVKSGNTPTLRLEQDGSSGFSPQTWDLAGNEANFFLRDATNGSTLPFRVFPSAPSNALTIEASTGDIGLGTTSPDQELDVEADTPAIRLTATTAGRAWDLNVNGTGRFNWNLDGSTKMRIDPQSNNNLLNIGFDAADTVSVNGNITATGTITPDYVFDPGYELESIEEHALFMWSNRRLPAVAPGTVNDQGKAVINLTARAQGVLEELEKAHIYIEELHEAIQRLTARVEELEGSQRQK